MTEENEIADLTAAIMGADAEQLATRGTPVPPMPPLSPITVRLAIGGCVLLLVLGVLLAITGRPFTGLGASGGGITLLVARLAILQSRRESRWADPQYRKLWLEYRGDRP